MAIDLESSHLPTCPMTELSVLKGRENKPELGVSTEFLLVIRQNLKPQKALKPRANKSLKASSVVATCSGLVSLAQSLLLNESLITHSNCMALNAGMARKSPNPFPFASMFSDSGQEERHKLCTISGRKLRMFRVLGFRDVGGMRCRVWGSGVGMANTH